MEREVDLMVKIKSKGSFAKTEFFLTHAKKLTFIDILDKYGKAGVQALKEHTPIDSGVMADSWYYKINVSSDSCSVSWYNSKIQNGTRLALILDYGHATRNGGYVVGRNFITPALQPIFDAMTNEAWEEIKHA